MATITCLPDEVIAIIIGYNDISIEDIINFRCVCKQFRWTVKYDKYFWGKKYIQRWPSAKKVYDKQSKENEQESEENERKNKKNFVKTGINCVRQLRSYVSQIIHKHYYDIESIDNFIKFEYIFHLDEHLRNNFYEIFKFENVIKYSFFIDEIKHLLTQSPRRTGCDLTERYCNIKMFHYMRQYSVREKWDRFEKQPFREQLLERKATMMAQWFQPQKDIFYSCIKASLDSIARKVLDCLREKHPDHSIFSTSAETFSYWKNNNIDDNHWNEAEGTQIMDTLEEYIFDKLNFQPSIKSENTNSCSGCMCIDNVLKNKYGHKLIVLVIYHSVARRLGLRCEVLNLGEYYLFWKPIYTTDSVENIRCYNISFKKFPDCLETQLFLITPPISHCLNFFISTRRQVGWKMIFKDLVRYAWGIMPQELIENGINLLSFSFHKKTEQLNTRPEDVKFAVGMIVTHRTPRRILSQLKKISRKIKPTRGMRHEMCSSHEMCYDDDQPTDSCTGVIIGWHRHIDKYVMRFPEDNVSDRYMYLRNILPLNHCRNSNFVKRQTNYIILTENNKMCHVEEDAITLTTPKWIDNSEIGRYFCKFEDTHYVPNKMLARLYPHDVAIAAKITISEN